MLSSLRSRSLPALLPALGTIVPRSPALSFETARSSTSAASSYTDKPGFFELRFYDLHPGGVKSYLNETKSAAQLRSSLFNTDKSKWLGFFTTETGGSIGRVYHLYHYEDHDARDKVRRALTSSAAWVNYLKVVGPHVATQNSLIFIEALNTLTEAGLAGAINFTPTLNKTTGPVTYELRMYQLKLGYNTVPEFLKLYGEGIQDKLRVDQTGASTLASLLYSDCGYMNKVIEVWRHESMQRSVDSRVASRASSKWKSAIAGIAELGHTFENHFVRPTSFSPWQ